MNLQPDEKTQQVLKKLTAFERSHTSRATGRSRLAISCMRFSIAARSSGVKGRSKEKS